MLTRIIHSSSLGRVKLRTQSACGTRRCYSLEEAFEIISRKRSTEYNFSKKPIPHDKVRKIIELTQMAPSSFNIQPFKLVVIQSDEMKDALAGAMLGANGMKVRNASTTVVFASDRVPTRNVREVMKIESENGKPPAYVSSLPAKITLLLGEGWLSKRMRALGTHLASPLVPTPSIATSNDAWSMKNTALAAHQMLMAATSMGIQSAAMEGFDERRVCSILSIPSDEYRIPVIISLGYSSDNSASAASAAASAASAASTAASAASEVIDAPKAFPPKARFSMREVCYSELFGRDMDF